MRFKTIETNTRLQAFRLPSDFRDKLINSTKINNQTSLAQGFDFIMRKYLNGEFSITNNQSSWEDNKYKLSLYIDIGIENYLKEQAKLNHITYNKQVCVILNNYFQKLDDTQV